MAYYTFRNGSLEQPLKSIAACQRSQGHARVGDKHPFGTARVAWPADRRPAPRRLANPAPPSMDGMAGPKVIRAGRSWAVMLGPRAAGTGTAIPSRWKTTHRSRGPDNRISRITWSSSTGRRLSGLSDYPGYPTYPSIPSRVGHKARARTFFKTLFFGSRVALNEEPMSYAGRVEHDTLE